MQRKRKAGSADPHAVRHRRRCGSAREQPALTEMQHKIGDRVIKEILDRTVGKGVMLGGEQTEVQPVEIVFRIVDDTNSP